MNNNRLGPKKWITLILFGFIGQIAWTIENMYLNIYIYKTVTYDPTAIAWMVALSAAVATIATIVMGALSDKLGKRKLFMSGGYILWGLTIIAFAFITKANTELLFPHADIVLVTVALIILLDCLMTYIGSTANDAAFFGWVNDVTNEHNRGRVEGLLATMPLLGMLVVFGALDGFTQSGNWLTFFLIVGSIVTVAGIVGLFIIKEEKVEPKKGNFFKNLSFGFMPKNIKQNYLIYIIFAAVSVLGIAQQIFLPYFIIYFEQYIGIEDYALLLGGILILASAISFAGGRLVDKYGKKKFLIPSTIVYAVGLFALFIFGLFLKEYQTLTIILTLLGGTIMMGAYLVALVPLNALARDIIPEGRAGSYSGVRMLFFVLLPMVIGPFIGSTIIKGNPNQYTDQFGESLYVPTPYIFLAGAIVALLTLIPIFFIKKINVENYKLRLQEEKVETNEEQAEITEQLNINKKYEKENL